MKSVYALMIAAACLGGCKKHGGGNVAGAKDVMAAFAKPGADYAALSAALRPKPDDYAAVFVGDAAQAMKAGIEPMWDGGKLTIKPSAGQTEIEVTGAAQPQLATGDGNALGCPGGYKGIAAKIQPKTVVHCVRFKKPGEKGGLHVDGLIYVNDHWALFPKPWRFIR